MPCVLIKALSMQLMLVGEENVGKTSLTRFLLSDALIDSAVPNVSTNGISISEWSGTNELQRSWRTFCPACFEYYVDMPVSVPGMIIISS